MSEEAAIHEALQEHSKLKDELSSQKDKYDELLKDLDDVRKQLAEKEVKAGDDLSSKLNKIDKEIGKNTEAITELDNRWTSVAELLHNYECFKASVNSRLNDIEQYSRLYSLIIHGLLNIPTGKDNKGLKFSIWVAGEINRLMPGLTGPITAQHIDVAHPLPTKSNGSKSAVIVKFCRRDIRNEVYYAKRCLKGTGVSISEHLTSSNLDLYNEARKITNCVTWTSQCKIFVKIDGTEKKVIRCQSDIDNLLHKEKSTPPEQQSVLTPDMCSTGLPPRSFQNSSTGGYNHNSDGFYRGGNNSGYGRGAPNPRGYYGKHRHGNHS